MTLHNLINETHLVNTTRAIFTLVLGFFIAKFLSSSVNKVFSKRLSAQQAMVLRRIIFYVIFLLFLASIIEELGFHISALLGATGILTVAIGIAAQTSMSNVISGIFIIGEKPFQIGDTIKVNDIQGEIISIDFLSIKIRTSENTMVRIPNEILIKTAVTNISYFPIRRSDLMIYVAYKSDIDLVKKILFQVAEKNTYCLSEPKPVFQILGFVSSSISIQFSAWGSKDNYQELKNTMLAEIKIAFDENNIEMRLPSTSFYNGSDAEPLPIKIMT